MNRVALVVAVLMLTACATAAPKLQLSPSEEADLARAMQTPLSFEVPADESEPAWGRAQAFVQKFSTMKIQTATDYVIETYNLNCASGHAASKYVARRFQVNKTTSRIEVNAWSCWLGEEQTKINAHVFAHFVKTGEMVCDRNGFAACLYGG